MWVFYASISALFLGLYDICKKQSVHNNAVIPVLFWASSTSGIIFTILLFFSRYVPEFRDTILYIPETSVKGHLFFMLKAIIVGASWIFAYLALKHLPITIVTPIRSTSPLWTLFGALLIYNEKPGNNQWIGICITLFFFYLFSIAGKLEGIHFRTNKWIGFIILATIIGAASGLYDKYLVQHYNRLAIQAWSSVYMIGVYLPFLLFWWRHKRNKTSIFTWRYTIPLIGILLSVADFAYFYSLSHPDALIAVIAVVRRASVVISFTLGGFIFKDQQIGLKAIFMLGIVVGVLFLILG
jgi:transporter family protein